RRRRRHGQLGWQKVNWRAEKSRPWLRKVYRAMLGGQGSNIAINEIRRLLTEFVKEDLSEFGDDVSVPRELRLQFVVGTFLTALTWCLGKRPKLQPSQI